MLLQSQRRHRVDGPQREPQRVEARDERGEVGGHQGQPSDTQGDAQDDGSGGGHLTACHWEEGLVHSDRERWDGEEGKDGRMAEWG